MSAETNAAKAALDIIGLDLNNHPLIDIFTKACNLDTSIVYLDRGLPCVWARVKTEPIFSFLISPSQDPWGFNRMTLFFYQEKNPSEHEVIGSVSAGYGFDSKRYRSKRKIYTVENSYNIDPKNDARYWLEKQISGVTRTYYQYFRKNGYPTPLPLNNDERTRVIRRLQAVFQS